MMIGTPDAMADEVVAAADGGAPSGKYRVLFMFRLHPGSAEAFLAAYETVREQVAQVPGHLVDQVCRSADDPDQWMITSEWESAEHFLSWERTPGHRQLAAPMLACMAERSSLRYLIYAETFTSEEISAGVSAEAPVGVR
jgi:heme oxygenase (mycobilin-producing)